MGDYSYLKPKAHQMGTRGVVNKKDGQFHNMPAYPEFGGFKNKSCLHMDNNHLHLEKSPSTRKGEPI
jgi:hypothetical protein